MNKGLKILSIPVAVALSVSVLALSACNDNTGDIENEDVPEEIHLEELFDYTELFIASDNFSFEYKMSADFSGDLDKLNLMEGMEQNFFVGIKRHENEQVFDLKYLNFQSEIYADDFVSMGTYQTNTQGERITLADSDANASRTLYLGQDSYKYDYLNGTFVKYGSRAEESSSDSDDDVDVDNSSGETFTPYLLIQSLIYQMLIIVDYKVNGNIELSSQFIMDKMSVDITEDLKVKIPKSLMDVFGISTEELKEEIKVKLTGNELIITASETCNHAMRNENDGNYNLYCGLEVKLNYAAGLTTEYFESLISG